MSAEKMLKLIADEGVEYVDVRFTDTRGKLQHVTVCADLVDEDFIGQSVLKGIGALSDRASPVGCVNKVRVYFVEYVAVQFKRLVLRQLADRLHKAAVVHSSGLSIKYITSSKGS